MDKTTYSTDTTAAVPGANFPIARSAVSATGNVSAGYFSGTAQGGHGIIGSTDVNLFH